MDDDDSDKGKRRQSLLSLGTTASGSGASRGAGSLLSAARGPSEDDAAARHRLVRSRREAAPSPLLSALAAMEGFRAEPAAEPKKSRWSLCDLLSPKVKYDKPDKESAIAAKPTRPTEPPAASKIRDETGPRVDAVEPVAPAEPVTEEVVVETSDVASDDPRWQPLIDPLRVIGGIGNSKALILTTTLLGALLGVAVALSTPKKYESVAELLVDPRDLKLSDRELTQTGLPSDATLALVENQVRVITSGTVLNKVVDRLKLEDDPEFNGQRQGGIGNIFASLRALLSSGKAGGEGDLRRALAVGNLAESLSVERAGKTFIVTVGATTEDPEKSALIANTTIDVFLQTSGELQSDTAGRAADELIGRLEELRDGLEQAERKVEKYRAENDLIDVSGRLISDDEMIKLNDQLSIARARTIELNARAASARSIRVDSVIGGVLPEELTSSVMSELRSQYAALKQEADRLSVRLGARHPQSLAIQAQLQGAREQIANELKRIVATVQTDLKRAVQQEQDLAARLAQLKVRSSDVSDDLVSLRELEREAAAKRAIYENYMLRAKEATEQRDINTANISVISQAYPPIEPTGPSRATIAISGAALGFVAGIGLGMARGVYSSLRGRSRTRRRSGLVSQPATAGSTNAAPEAQADGYRQTDAGDEQVAANASGDAATGNPILRLIERVRRSASPDAARGSAAGRTASPAVSSKPEHRSREIPASQEAPPMYPFPPQQPAYPQAAPYAQAPMQQAPYVPQQPLPPYPPAFVQPYPHFPQPQVAYPYPAAMPPQPAFHGWQPQPVAVSPYGYPQPVAAPYPMYPQAATQPAPYPQEARPATRPAPQVPSEREMTSIEEVRESLREFREAIRDLAEGRARRRYS